MLNMLPVIGKVPFYCTAHSKRHSRRWCKWAAVWITTVCVCVCVFDGRDAGPLSARNVWKHEVWHWKGIGEMMWVSRQQPGGWSDAQVAYYSTFFSFFCSCVTPRLCSALPAAARPVCPTVFAMNTFRESPLCGTWWMRSAGNTFTANAFPLTRSHDTLHVYILHFNSSWNFSC